MNTLSKIQELVKAPKGQYNKFGNYKYRSCEDIVEAVKQVVNPMGFYLTINDEVVNIGNRFYIKATAILSNGEETFSTTAFAREEEVKKGMDGSQITGASSSYARKYALNGLFAIDDTKDADATNTHEKNNTPTVEPVPTEDEKKLLVTLAFNSTLNDDDKKAALNAISNCIDYNQYQKLQHRLEVLQTPIDQVFNPSQRDINKKVKEIANA
jgi:hypothetical protein